MGGHWCGVVWCGVVWCGVVWCGVVWCGVVWHNIQVRSVCGSSLDRPHTGSPITHTLTGDPVRWRDHDVYRSLWGKAFHPQGKGMCILVMYAIPAVPAILVGV